MECGVFQIKLGVKKPLPGCGRRRSVRDDTSSKEICLYQVKILNQEDKFSADSEPMPYRNVYLRKKDKYLLPSFRFPLHLIRCHIVIHTPFHPQPLPQCFGKKLTATKQGNYFMGFPLSLCVHNFQLNFMVNRA